MPASLPRGITALLPDAVLKAIYGDQFRNFMGMQDETTGVESIQNTSADYNRAYTIESIIYRLVDIRTKAASQAPLKVFATDHSGKQVAVDHDALAVIKVGGPNWVAGEMQFKKFSLASLDLQGRLAYELAFGSGRYAQIPTEMYYVPGSAFEPEATPEGYFKGIKIKGTAGQPERHIAASKLFYHHTVNPDIPWRGLSKIAAARTQINLNLASLNSNTMFFRNGMQGHNVMTGDWDNTDQNVNLIERALRRFRGAANSHKTLVVGKNTKISPLSVSPKDAEWVMQQKLSLEALCAIFGVPLPMYGNLDNGTYANYDQAHSTFWTDTMMGDLNDFADGLTRNFLSRWPDAKGLAFGFDYNQIRGLSEDINKIWERFMNFMDRIEKQVAAHVLTPNQANQLLGSFADQLGLDARPYVDKVPHGDTFLVPFGTLPAEQVSVQALINIEAARSGHLPELIENVPGAEHAADHAREAITNRQSLAEAGQQTEMAAAPGERKFLPRVIEGGVKATPHPIPIRDARTGSIVSAFERRLKRFFQDQQTTALRTLRGEKSAKHWNLEEPLWNQQEAKDELEQIVEEFVDQATAAAFKAAIEEYGINAPDSTSPFLGQYMAPRLHLIRGIDDTTANAVKAALAKGYQEGESMPQLGERVKGVFREAIDSRALKIARTETIQAYGQASLAAYRQAGIEKARMYDGPNDDSADCADVDGREVTLAEAERLMAEEHPQGTRGVAPVIDLPMAAGLDLEEQWPGVYAK